ncbi:hypothetical protein [Nocardiopsis alba]|uniref:hypothetical protein n=1 Tax=Nocardiopsis alba TaxID=53437 RepID=UPI003D74EC5C
MSGAALFGVLLSLAIPIAIILMVLGIFRIVQRQAEQPGYPSEEPDEKDDEGPAEDGGEEKREKPPEP